MLAKLKFEINGEDFREGLTAVVSVKVAEPQFEGQTKTKLGNSEVSAAVNGAVSSAMALYLEEHPRDAKAIVQKVILAATARHAAHNARAAVQRKTVLSGAGLPGKLADCSSRDRSIAEIFFVEGDSAGGTAKQGRDRNFQAIMPLRGKILNIEKAQEHRMWENEEIKNMFIALGVSIGTEEDSKALNLEKLRYDKIIIMTDADVDGAHIATLMLTFFFRKMKELIENGHIYVLAGENVVSSSESCLHNTAGSTEDNCGTGINTECGIEILIGKGGKLDTGLLDHSGKLSGGQRNVNVGNAFAGCRHIVTVNLKLLSGAGHDRNNEYVLGIPAHLLCIVGLDQSAAHLLGRLAGGEVGKKFGIVVFAELNPTG